MLSAATARAMAQSNYIKILKEKVEKKIQEAIDQGKFQIIDQNILWPLPEEILKQLEAEGYQVDLKEDYGLDLAVISW